MYIFAQNSTVGTSKKSFSKPLWTSDRENLYKALFSRGLCSDWWSEGKIREDRLDSAAELFFAQNDFGSGLYFLVSGTTKFLPARA